MDPAITANYYLNLLNVFIMHYNTLNNTNIHMFFGINEIHETNDILEEFYEHLAEYKRCDEDDKKLHAIDRVELDDYEQLFGLQVNGQIICVCGILIPIIEYIVKEIDWTQGLWQIIPLKFN